MPAEYVPTDKNISRSFAGNRDAPLMAEILTVQTLVALLTMPLMMQLGG